jgi:hypothetical protein
MSDRQEAGIGGEVGTGIATRERISAWTDDKFLAAYYNERLQFQQKDPLTAKLATAILTYRLLTNSGRLADMNEAAAEADASACCFVQVRLWEVPLDSHREKFLSGYP